MTPVLRFPQNRACVVHAMGGQFDSYYLKKYVRLSASSTHTHMFNHNHRCVGILSPVSCTLSKFFAVLHEEMEKLSKELVRFTSTYGAEGHPARDYVYHHCMPFPPHSEACTRVQELDVMVSQNALW